MLNYIALIFCANFVFNVYGMETKARVAVVKESTVNSTATVKLSDGQKALFGAIYEADIKTVKDLIKGGGVDFSVRNERGDTPLVLAINAGEEEISLTLIEFAPVSNALWGICKLVSDPADGGITPLMAAVTSRSEKLVKALSGKGAFFTVNMQDEGGMTALMRAAKLGDWEMATLLIIKLRADTSLKNKKDQTAQDIMLMVDNDDRYLRTLAFIEAVASDRDVESLAFFNRGIDVEAFDFYDGNTPLLAATKHQRWELVEKLLKAGADVNAQNKAALTALGFILEDVSVNKIPLTRVKFLIEAGADVTVRDAFDELPLKAFLERYDENDELYAEVRALLAPKVVEAAAGLSLSLSEN